MAENRIKYISRTYDDYKQSIRDITKKYYPSLFYSLNDSSIGEWLIEMISDVGDNLSYHTDRVYQETNIDSAQEKTSILALARSRGLKIPGPKAAVVEVEVSCELPLQTDVDNHSNGRLSMADLNYAPCIKRGTLFSTGSVTFELNEDLDFKEQFNSDGYSNREIIPNRDSNGNLINYTYKKLGIATAAQSKIYRMTVQSSDIKPFMTITLNDDDILGVDSIIVKEGERTASDPSISEFFVDEEEYSEIGEDEQSSPLVRRFFEVDNLIDQYRFGYEVEKTEEGYYSPVWEDQYVIFKDEETNWEYNIVTDDNNGNKYVTNRVVKGKWKRLKNKFTTEFTDNGKLTITFGAGLENQYGTIPTDASNMTQYMMSKMYANDYMGVLPKEGDTIYVLYRVGGGEISNIAQDTLKSILSLTYTIDGNCRDNSDSKKKRAVRDSLSVTNPTVSYGGKDSPSIEEIRQMIKYNNGAQNRCVTIKDYYAMLMKMPPKYGLPFRYGIIEENNKIAIYTLGLLGDGTLTNILSETVANNMKEYLSMYKTINDFIEIKSGKIINVSFTITIYADKSYDKGEVAKRVISLVYDYMDIHKHTMGEDIYLGDMQKEISKLDGVIQFVSMTCKNEHGEGYSDDVSTQEMIDTADCCYSNGSTLDDGGVSDMINLDASDYILFSEANSMFEIKNKDKDITVIVKTR